MARGDILLESGTNEVEIAEFELAGQKFGINVAKIREFIPLKGLDISHLPNRPRPWTACSCCAAAPSP